MKGLTQLVVPRKKTQRLCATKKVPGKCVSFSGEQNKLSRWQHITCLGTETHFNQQGPQMSRGKAQNPTSHLHHPAKQHSGLATGSTHGVLFARPCGARQCRKNIGHCPSRGNVTIVLLIVSTRTDLPGGGGGGGGVGRQWTPLLFSFWTFQIFSADGAGGRISFQKPSSKVANNGCLCAAPHKSCLMTVPPKNNLCACFALWSSATFALLRSPENAPAWLP